MPKPKGVSIHRMKRTEQVYTFQNDTTGEVFHFAVDMLNAYLRTSGIEPTNIVIHKGLIQHLVQRGGVEPQHLESLPEKALSVPGTMIDFGDGTHIQVDGAHRAIRCALRGDETYPAYLVPEKVWRRFLIIDIPPDLVDWKEFLTTGTRKGPKPPWEV